MKKIAIIISKTPHGSASGREALDAILALSSMNDVSLFFMGDGLFHLLPNQQPDKILARDYIATFGVLELYDIEKIYVSEQDLMVKGLSADKFIIDVLTISQQQQQHFIQQQDSVLFF